MENLKLGLYNEKNEYIGGYLTFNKIEDLYIYMGLLFNESIEEIKIIYLQYFNRDYNTTYEKYFYDWVSRVGNNGTLCRYKEGKKEYTIKIIN